MNATRAVMNTSVNANASTAPLALDDTEVARRPALDIRGGRAGERASGPSPILPHHVREFVR